RTARGVRGIRLGDGQRVISLINVNEGDVLTVTEKGYGKRTAISDYPVHGRGGQGVISIQTNERNGRVVGAALVKSEDEIMLISDNGTLVRTRVEEISVMSRNTQGVRLIRLSDDESLIGVQRIVDPDDDEGDESALDDEQHEQSDAEE
ncbi:MAG: DNA gyrase C-terminal beta-propeller domain-containing protein, partial [Pseudomonadota bacterium]|nr:DNA gyrase C-terminal beta-propeller domain-containing protein [Pseudomonadota bacterium]